MFGYVTINQDELKLKEYRRYRGFYCGLCRSLKKRYGFKGQLLLPNDLTFANILLNGLYERELTVSRERCIVHPMQKQLFLYNDITDYCADMGLLLAYYKMLDDVKDDRSIKAGLYARSLRKAVERISGLYPRQAAAVSRYVRELTAQEDQNSSDLDAVSGVTGQMLSEILIWKEDEFSDEVRRVGFFLGKYIYLLDAYEDLPSDRKKGRYNPWGSYCNRDDFEALVENTLTMMMAECARSFERLPIVQDIAILRNILYSGVWIKYREVQKKRLEETGDLNE